MKLPDIADAIVVDPRKLRDYLLSPAHPIGRFKAAFFSRLGYTQRRWRELESDLRVLAHESEAMPTESTQYGQKYEVHGRLVGPAGKSAIVVTVWIVRAEDGNARFVTAHPGAQR